MPDLKHKFIASKLWRFIYASGYWALVGMGSGLISLTLLLMGVKSSPTFFGIFVISMIVFCWGAYKAWSKTADALEAETSRNATPELSWIVHHAYIDKIASSPVMAILGFLGSDYALVILDATISNNTAAVPTRITEIKLSINTGSHLHQGEFLSEASGLSIDEVMLHGATRTVSCQSIDRAITEKSPLTYGVPRRCWIVFLFGNLPAESYEQALVILTLRDGTWWSHTQKDTVDFEQGRISAGEDSGITIVAAREEKGDSE